LLNKIITKKMLSRKNDSWSSSFYDLYFCRLSGWLWI
jgi:hypothetical protein